MDEKPLVGISFEEIVRKRQNKYCIPKNIRWATTSIADDRMIQNTDLPNLSIINPNMGAAKTETKLGMEINSVAVSGENFAPVCCMMSLWKVWACWKQGRRER